MLAFNLWDAHWPGCMGGCRAFPFDYLEDDSPEPTVQCVVIPPSRMQSAVGEPTSVPVESVADNRFKKLSSDAITRLNSMPLSAKRPEAHTSSPESAPTTSADVSPSRGIVRTASNSSAGNSAEKSWTKRGSLKASGSSVGALTSSVVSTTASAATTLPSASFEPERESLRDSLNHCSLSVAHLCQLP
jgi:hypothetical protein